MGSEKNDDSRFLIGLTCLAITLLCFFFWKENLSTSLKINDSKFYNYFASIGSLLTGLSIVYIARQLNESRKSREAMFLPDMIPKQASFLLKVQDETYGKVKVNQVLIRNKDTAGKAIQELPFVELYNAGVGVAKDVEITWEYSEEQVTDTLHNNNMIDSGKGSRESQGQFVSYIVVGQTGKAEPPYHYLQVYRPELNPKLDDIIFDTDSSVEKPPLVLKIGYKDSLNNNYTNRYSTELIAIEDSLEMKFRRLD